MMTERVSTPPDDHDAIAALMRWIGTLYHPRHAADECVAVHATAQHYAGQVLEFAYHSARRAPRHQDPELVVFDMLKGLEEHWRTEWRAIPAAARPVDAKEAVLSPPTRARVPQPPPPETGNDTLAPLGARLWRQVENGMDRERLLPTIASRRKVLAKKLDRPLEKNGYRTFVAGCAHTIATGKPKHRRGAECALVRAVSAWVNEVTDVWPERAGDLRRIVDHGIANPGTGSAEVADRFAVRKGEAPHE